MKTDVLVVGAGFAGSVVAERLAAAGKEVVVIDKRLHLAGNAFDHEDAHGVLVHCYGPHIFHTQSQAVFEYLSRFTKWHPYHHRVLSSVGGQLYPIPINQTTINRLYRLNLDERGVKAFFESVRTRRYPETTSEDVILNCVGVDLCDKFFRNYTYKQWGLPLSKLDASVARRIPVRTDQNDCYFSDRFQFMPSKGYTAMFKRLLDHPLIRVELGVDFDIVRDKLAARHIVYTGPIDSYFKNAYGKLPYRSLHFEHIHHADKNLFQPVAVVNYPNDFKFTRITEFKHFTEQKCRGTSIAREYPKSDGDPFYPIPNFENSQRYQKYKILALRESHVTFVGRLAEYCYYNMDQVVAAAINHTRIIIDRWPVA